MFYRNSSTRTNTLLSPHLLIMKQIFGIIAAIAIGAGSAYAGCGKKVTDSGEVTSYDSDTKTLTVDGAKKPFKIQASTVVKNAEGEEVELSDLEGKEVDVVSEHNKADSVTEKAG